MINVAYEQYMTSAERGRHYLYLALKAALLALSVAIVSAVIAVAANAQSVQPASVKIDLSAIAQIESSGCVNKVSKRPGDESYGCHQITPGTLSEYNQMTGHAYAKNDLLRDEVSYAVADWYLHKRIPQMIRHYKKPVTAQNILIAYNAGISYVKNGTPIPSITKKYLEKYAKLTK